MENNGHSEASYKHVAQAAVVVLTCKHEKSDSTCHSCHTSCLWQGSENCGDIYRHRNNTSCQFACVSNDHFMDCRCVRASVVRIYGSPTTLRAAARCLRRVCWPVPWLCLSSGGSRATIQGVFLPSVWQSFKDVVNLLTSIVKKQSSFPLQIVFDVEPDHHVFKPSKPLFPSDNGGGGVVVDIEWWECWQRYCHVETRKRLPVVRRFSAE